MKPVTVSLADLEDGEEPPLLRYIHGTIRLRQHTLGTVTIAQLEEAFGAASLGIILVSGLPEPFSAMRSTLLSYSSYLANLPQHQLGKRNVFMKMLSDLD